MLKYYLRDTAFYRFMRRNDIEDFVYYGLIALAVFLSIYLIRKRLKFFGHDSTKLKRFFIITAVIVVTEEKKEEIFRAYQERASQRGIARAFGISRQTLVNWLKKSF